MVQALGGATARGLEDTIQIINPSGLPVFGTILQNDAAPCMILTQLWRFTPCASGIVPCSHMRVHYRMFKGGGVAEVLGCVCEHHVIFFDSLRSTLPPY